MCRCENLHAHFMRKWCIKPKLITFEMKSKSTTASLIVNIFLLVVSILFLVLFDFKSLKAIEEFPIRTLRVYRVDKMCLFKKKNENIIVLEKKGE